MNILLVDDSSLYRMLLQNLVDETGDTLHTIKDGASTLHMVSQKTFDFAVISMQLVDMDGLTLTKQLRDIPDLKFVPILILSSTLTRELALKAEQIGVTEIFRKQDIEELMHYMRRFLIRFRPLDGKVLYVEDNLSQQLVMAEQLKMWGLQVDSYSNADEAWQPFMEGTYDLVMTDVVLDGNLSGTRFINRVRRQGGALGDTPILALTAFDTEARRIQLFQLGVSDYVAKPTLAEELYSRIHSLISSKRIIEREQQLSLALQQVERANSAKSVFLSTMSHELRTPMNAILGYAQLMQMDQITPEHLEYTRDIIQAGNHLLHLINETLDLAKIEAGHIDIVLEKVDVGSVMDECISLVRTLAAEKRVTLEHAGMQGKTIETDRKRLKQVLLNLLSNAIKYNQPGGSVSIKGENVEDQLLRISVSDTGQGIDSEQLPELFEPFKRLGAENTGIEGTGIGLSISKQIVELMGGSLNVRSEVGVGSTFWIDLPNL